MNPATRPPSPPIVSRPRTRHNHPTHPAIRPETPSTPAGAKDPRKASVAGRAGETQPAGRWRGEPTVGADPEPLSWEQAESASARFRRVLSVPALVSVAVFVVALAITATVLIRGLGGTGEVGLAQADGRDGSSATGTGGDGVGPGAHAGTGAVDAHAGGAGELVTQEAKLVVHVVGEVVNPGVLELDPGSRVLDAITAAGGPTESAALAALNLAREVSDGEQIVILDAETAAEGAGGSLALPGTGAPTGGAAGGEGAVEGRVNVNTAGAEGLTELPGIGPAIAQRIIDWREANGRFADVDQLLEVSGIGSKTLDKFRDRVVV
ncbi:helix-hairpin-helix domain-containing protein [Leucobacter aridicollis]|nr:helix-hairpin-helix domain-containing protein [Leucobacter aridicollis]